jgi:ERF superfamily
MTADRRKSLREKMYQVYNQIDFIAKDGKNSGQNYSYTKAVDVVRNVRAALLAQRIFAEINFDFVGGPYTIARSKEPNAPFSAVNVKCSITFHDLDSTSETLTGSGLGTGADTGDKAGYKAMTGALKYALKTAFMIPDEAGDDAEADPTLDENANSSLPDADPTDEPLPEAKPQPKEEKPKAAKKEKEKAASVPKSEIPAWPFKPTTETPAEAAAAVRDERAATPEAAAGDSGDTLTEAEMEVFRKRFKKLSDDLTTDGKLKASKNLPVNRKILVFLLHITKAKDATTISKAQWTDFFKRVDAATASPEVGLVGLATLVNRANGVDEKKK